MRLVLTKHDDQVKRFLRKYFALNVAYLGADAVNFTKIMRNFLGRFCKPIGRALNKQEKICLSEYYLFKSVINKIAR